MALIIKSNIRKTVKDLQESKTFQSSAKNAERDKDDIITGVADEVETALERKVEDILAEGIKRAKLNGRKTLQARDL
ncbi:MAG: hypothetical protein WD876_01940 [Candidatus Pacearchaeota archaeon]